MALVGWVCLLDDTIQAMTNDEWNVFSIESRRSGPPRRAEPGPWGGDAVGRLCRCPCDGGNGMDGAGRSDGDGDFHKFELHPL